MSLELARARDASRFILVIAGSSVMSAIECLELTVLGDFSSIDSSTREGGSILRPSRFDFVGFLNMPLVAALLASADGAATAC